MKLHRKIENNEKVCRAQELGYYAQGQGHNHVRCQIELKIRSEMTSYVLCQTLVPWLCSRSQPGIKAIIRINLRGHLFHTVTFLVFFFLFYILFFQFYSSIILLIFFFLQFTHFLIILSIYQQIIKYMYIDFTFYIFKVSLHTSLI